MGESANQFFESDLVSLIRILHTCSYWMDSKHRDPDHRHGGYADPYAQGGEKGRKKGGFHTPCAKIFKTPGSSHPFALSVLHFWQQHDLTTHIAQP